MTDTDSGVQFPPRMGGRKLEVEELINDHMHRRLAQIFTILDDESKGSLPRNDLVTKLAEIKGLLRAGENSQKLFQLMQSIDKSKSANFTGNEFVTMVGVHSFHFNHC